MKKTIKIILIIFIVLSVSVGTLAIWQWKNIQSIILGVSENSEQIEKRRNDNQTKLAQDVSTYMDEPLREMSEEEKKQIKEGNVSVNEVYQKMFEEKSENIEEKVSSTEKEPSANLEKTGNKDEIISRYMTQLYKLQNEFTAKAEATIKRGDNYYENIKAHPQDPVARANTITHFTPVVRAMEKECDVKVEEVLSNLRKELEAIGADTAIIETIRKTYANEKQLKLSYYANKYLK